MVSKVELEDTVIRAIGGDVFFREGREFVGVAEGTPLQGKGNDGSSLYSVRKARGIWKKRHLLTHASAFSSTRL